MVRRQLLLTYFLIPARTDRSLAGRPDRRTPEIPDWRADGSSRVCETPQISTAMASFVEDWRLWLRTQTAQSSVDAVG